MKIIDKTMFEPHRRPEGEADGAHTLGEGKEERPTTQASSRVWLLKLQPTPPPSYQTPQKHKLPRAD